MSGGHWIEKGASADWDSRYLVVRKPPRVPAIVYQLCPHPIVTRDISIDFSLAMSNQRTKSPLICLASFVLYIKVMQYTFYTRDQIYRLLVSGPYLQCHSCWITSL